MHASSKINISSAYRQPITATDSPQLDSKPHASLGRSRDSDNNNNNNNNNNKPNSPAHTDSQAYIAKAQWHDAQATARNSTVYIMLIRIVRLDAAICLSESQELQSKIVA